MLDTRSSVIQRPSAPIEAVRNTINIRFSIYIGTDCVRLTFFLTRNRKHRRAAAKPAACAPNIHLLFTTKVDQTNNETNKQAEEKRKT